MTQAPFYSFINRSLFTAAALLLSTLAFGDDYEAPRLPNGQPDLQGIWTNVSLTRLQRSRQYDSNVLTPEEAEAIAKRTAEWQKRGLEPTDPDAPPPPKGTRVGGYNSFYLDQGDRLAFIDGTYRTTWLTNQEDGKLPYSEAGKKLFEEKLAFARNSYDNPEARPMAERCIVGFGSTAGPPMMNVQYNNNYQIVQTEDTIMILVEMNHDARIIRMNDDHFPPEVTNWFGDSVGHWEGDTLVVETKHFDPGASLRTWFDQSFYVSPDAVITERFTRVADSQIHYEFAVDDPKIYEEVWKGKMVFNKTDEPIYEYACHEGNHALPNILAGARAEEKEAEKE